MKLVSNLQGKYLPREIIWWHNRGVLPREDCTKKEEYIRDAKCPKCRMMHKAIKRRREKKNYIHSSKGTSAIQKAYIVPQDKEARKYK